MYKLVPDRCTIWSVQVVRGLLAAQVPVMLLLQSHMPDSTPAHMAISKACRADTPTTLCCCKSLAFIWDPTFISFTVLTGSAFRLNI